MIEIAIVGLCVYPAIVIYAALKFLYLALFPVSYDLQNQPLREAAFLARELIANDKRRREFQESGDWREGFVGSIDEFNVRDAA